MQLIEARKAEMETGRHGRIVIADFGLGNMRSVEKALEHLGHPGVITGDPEDLPGADRIILPGDGAFGAAMVNLSRPGPSGRAFADVLPEVISAGIPLLGICVGMQVLLDHSEEFGSHRGLGIIPGEVRRFPEGPGLKIPQIGWNELHFTREDCPLFHGLRSGSMVYFIHSFYCAPSDPAVVAATTVHGIEYCSVLHRANIFATQFHPEKSGEVGLTLLANFLSGV